MAKFDPTDKGLVKNGWGSLFSPVGRHPVIDNRIWNTLADAQNFVDTNKTAIAGLVLTVINDTAEKNGVYFVEYANGELDNDLDHGKLVKIGDGSGTITVETIDLAVTDAKAKKAAGLSPIGQIYFVQTDRQEHQGEAGTYIVSSDGSLSGDVDIETAIKNCFTKFGAATSADELAGRVQSLEKKAIYTVRVNGNSIGTVEENTIDLPIGINLENPDDNKLATTKAVKDGLVALESTINGKIQALKSFNVEVVESLESVKEPNFHTLYLLKVQSPDKPDNNICDEYLWVEDTSEAHKHYWEKLGTQKLDLTEYAKKADLDNYVKLGTFNTLSSDVSKLGSDVKTITDSLGTITDSLGSYYTDASAGSIETILNSVSTKASQESVTAIETSLGTYLKDNGDGTHTLTVASALNSNTTAVNNLNTLGSNIETSLGTYLSGTEGNTLTIPEALDEKANADTVNKLSTTVDEHTEMLGTIKTTLGTYYTNSAKVQETLDSSLNSIEDNSTAEDGQVETEITATTTATDETADAQFKIVRVNGKKIRVKIDLPKVETAIVDSVTIGTDSDDSKTDYIVTYSNNGKTGLISGKDKQKLDSIGRLTDKMIDSAISGSVQ